MWTCPKCGEALEDQFDSCWKCARNQSSPAVPRPRLKLKNYLVAALIAYLIPWVAICVQSSHGQYGWWYTAILANINFSIFLWTLVPGAINFLILLPFLKHPVQSRIAAIFLLLGWTWLLLSSTPKLK
jgi:hypothetical protein